ncbi:PREDICTED: protein AHNAK2 [Chinchilla lanigera]|uniref:protein AHNAK2 n=1 Tax=Chinchilla lanigera TaxID=34839 RepID=UPI000696CF05|nr:PREDICTED: protein AHNAK2 [Chinchilla lanigera]
MLLLLGTQVSHGQRSALPCPSGNGSCFEGQFAGCHVLGGHLSFQSVDGVLPLSASVGTGEAVSGRQLQPEEPDVETEDTSVTEGPAGEIIRPRPQGSSPVYECATEGDGFGVQDDAPSRRGSSGRRRSWWKRDSGDARTFSNMSRPQPVQEATEVTLKTEVEVGASGYSVTGGGDQGIFVKQVLKDSSAAKLFSLREGDQLLSATIFFDGIKYEDALKILQYSEPYKVQFQIKRKLHAPDHEEWALHSAQHRSEEKQDKEVADGCEETPKKTLEEDGDRERLITEPTEARGRKSRDRFSWPKFQGVKGKQRPGPRRSHSSSEAYERGGAREVSPTSTDTEAQFPAEHGEQKGRRDGQRRKRRFLSLRFRRGSRPETSTAGHQERERLGGLDTTGVLEESTEDTGAGDKSQNGAQAEEARQALTMKQAMESSFPAQGEGATAGHQRKKKWDKPTEQATAQGEARAQPTRATNKDDEWEEAQSLTTGMQATALRGTGVTDGTQTPLKEIEVRILELKTPKFTFSTERGPEIEDKKGRGQKQSRETTSTVLAGHEAEGQAETQRVEKAQPKTGGTGPGEKPEVRERKGQETQGPHGEDTEKESADLRTKMSRFKMPAFVWSPTKEVMTERGKQVARKEQEPLRIDTTAEQEGEAGQQAMKLLEGALPAAGTGPGLKGHLPKVQMPSIKMPKVDLKGPQVDVKGAKGELRGPELEVSLPSVEVDVQAPGGKLQGEVSAKAYSLDVPSLLVPCSLSSGGGIIVSSSDVLNHQKFAEIFYPLDSHDRDNPEGHFPVESHTSSDVTYSSDAGDSRFKISSVEVPSFHFSQFKEMKGAPGPEKPRPSALLPPAPSVGPDLSPLEPVEQVVSGSRTAMVLPKLTLSGLPSYSSGSFDLTCSGPASSFLPPSECVALTQFPVAVLAPGGPQNGASGSLALAPSVRSQCSADPQAEQDPQASPTGQHSYLEDPLSLRVTFPKFHKPRFMVPVPLAVAPEGGTAECSLAPPLGQELGQDSSARAVKVSPLSGSQPAPRAAPASQMLEEAPSLSVEEASAEGADGEGTGGSFKTPRFKLPLFSRLSKKEARPAGDTSRQLEDHSGSLTVDLGHEDFYPGVQGSCMEAHEAPPPGKEGDLGKTRKAGFTLPRLALPKLKASKVQAGLKPQGDADTLLSSSAATGDHEATGRSGSEGGVGSTGLLDGPQEAGHVAHQLPQPPFPRVAFAKPDVPSSPAKEGVSQREADRRWDSAVERDSKVSGLGDISASGPHGEGTAPTIEEPLKPSLGHADQVPTLDRPEEAPTAEGTAPELQERWFKMPRLRMPGFGRPSSKERGGAREQDVAQAYMLVATAPAQAAAAGSALVSCVPGSEVEASVSLQSPNTAATVTGCESACYSDVLKRDLYCSGLKPQPPTVGGTGGDQPPSKVRTRPAEGSLPLQEPSGRPLEPQAPAAERCTLTRAEEKTELQPSLPEGPVTLRVSSTNVPSQVSVVDMRQLWEDSVLTVTFPKLRVPKFSFPAPGSEADIFFPVVRDERGRGVGVDPGPGLWDASLLRAGPGEPREQPAGPDQALEASPVSKVKVHIQGAQGESREVMVCSQVRRECVELMVPETISTQMVRESEIHTSTMQTPSYGFSLLKLKPLGPPAQAPDPRAQEGSAAARADSFPEDSAPEAAEPFEVLSASASLPRPPTIGSEVPARAPTADSGSDDEEPAEILEFLPEDSEEAAAPPAAEDRALKGRPGGKKPGAFWSWLPSIGFSSTVSDTTADSREDTQGSVPVQTQPGPRPDLESPKRQERVGWFRFPKLGFSSSPTKKTKSVEDETGVAEQLLQEESVTFFDARESFSPEEKEGEPGVSAPGTTGMVASPARTELILLEPDPHASEESEPRPTSK